MGRTEDGTDWGAVMGAEAGGCKCKEAAGVGWGTNVAEDAGRPYMTRLDDETGEGQARLTCIPDAEGDTCRAVAVAGAATGGRVARNSDRG